MSFDWNNNNNKITLMLFQAKSRVISCSVEVSDNSLLLNLGPTVSAVLSLIAV